jgi:glycosyltransferase involved in cell wall biosynthesis
MAIRRTHRAQRRHAALAKAIETLIADTDRRGVLVSAARKRVEHDLSFERRVKALDDLYQTLMEKP